jgi:hypothetical protein
MHKKVKALAAARPETIHLLNSGCYLVVSVHQHRTWFLEPGSCREAEGQQMGQGNKWVRTIKSL